MSTKKKINKCFYPIIGLLFCFTFINSTTIYAQDVPIDEPPLPPDSIRVFDYVQVQPKFLGSDVRKYFNENTVKFPAGSKVRQGNNIVWVNFVVEKDGSVSTIKIIRTSDTALNKEAIRITADSKWIAGEQNGKPVKVRLLKPINFKVLIVSADSTMKK